MALDSLFDKDIVLTNEIGNETLRATGAENRLDSKIDAEIARAEAAENAIDGKIGSGFTDDSHN